MCMTCNIHEHTHEVVKDTKMTCRYGNDVIMYSDSNSPEAGEAPELSLIMISAKRPSLLQNTASRNWRRSVPNATQVQLSEE